ncbi:Irc21p NDAI_0H01370 [Naumovozyma dairenensis CBS 421]|uniref:Cytochrome b5 heme-binding domain-containing protein n=1 Tax=Naumovozyma dairenensis (strain ATCC 10597 / BCRC 20456 / CBS 421 / NBRC 0211 / NRRL Y-12639) TaxID=1071378 RepID=G0WEV0_NAUDC|nr:hypothetical protein NDAI_0H01370 [Naumovozyma dairenensis CBS 421]CCD26311.1 hypothetical protein NDAI_0H01370 [Naumovozyma dairenensis CBS 421]
MDSKKDFKTPKISFQIPTVTTTTTAANGNDKSNKLQQNRNDLDPRVNKRVMIQSGCSTLGSNVADSDDDKNNNKKKIRNKVRLKPGHSALDWYKLTNEVGIQGKLITGLDSLIKDEDFLKLNNPNAGNFKCFMFGVPTFKLKPYLRFNHKILQKHVSEDDCWTVHNGKVYCMTYYLHFHPGGADILLEEAAGKDCTRLFNEYHPWVNVEKLFETCLIGAYVSEP